MEETLTCAYVDLTPNTDWDPYRSDSHSSSGIAKIATKSLGEQGVTGDDLQHIGKVLMGQNLEIIFEKKRLLHSFTLPGEPEFRSVSALTARKKNKLSPEELSKLWRIGLKATKRTLGATTHTCIGTVGNLTCQFKTDKAHLRYKRLAMQEGSFYVDTLFSKVKSIQGFTCGNLYTTTLGFKKFFPMESKTGQECSNSLQSLIHLIGIPPLLHSDNAPEFVQGEFKKKCRKFDNHQTVTEPYSLWQNRAEAGIIEVKSYVSKIMERH